MVWHLKCDWHKLNDVVIMPDSLYILCHSENSVHSIHLTGHYRAHSWTIFNTVHCTMDIYSICTRFIYSLYLTPVFDETKNLSEIESETFFRYQFFSIPNPILFPIPIFFRYRYFFRYQNFTKPIPILFLIPKFFETDTDTFFDTIFFRNRYRYFFWNQKFSKPIPIPSQQLE